MQMSSRMGDTILPFDFIAKFFSHLRNWGIWTILILFSLICQINRRHFYSFFLEIINLIYVRDETKNASFFFFSPSNDSRNDNNLYDFSYDTKKGKIQTRSFYIEW